MFYLCFTVTPTIDVNLNLLKLEIYEDETGSVECTATGDPAILGYQWFYNGVAIADTDDRFVISDSGRQKSTLTITSASLSMDEAVVLCEARNRIDTESVYAVVRIVGRLRLQNKPYRTNKLIEVLVAPYTKNAE